VSLSELTDKVQHIIELVGPNIYLQAALIAVLFIVLAKIADWLLSGILSRLAKQSSSPVDDHIVLLLHRPVFLSVVFLGLGLATYRMALPVFTTFITIAVLKTYAIFIWYNTLRHLMALLVSVFSRKDNNKIVQTGMLSLLHNVSKVMLVALTGYFIFVAWEINVTAWLASAGILGLALSFAAKDTLSNLFAGVSIIMDSPYKTGDFIILDSGERGVVTDIGLRSTRILTRDDVEITIPNGLIGNGKIINEAGGPPSQHRIRVGVGVAYGSDIDQVIEVLERVALDNTEILASPAPRVRFRSFGDSSLDFELLGWIRNPADRGRIKHDLNCAVYKTLNNHRIEIPFPQRDLHVRTMPASTD
jgi:small-conductance mechanosensitive channel